ncbi:hypothetical protein ACP70R_025245 [Stipagrostis hirtigluma subsp. patula]
MSSADDGPNGSLGGHRKSFLEDTGHPKTASEHSGSSDTTTDSGHDTQQLLARQLILLKFTPNGQ